ncbi:hypothetical protein Tco_0955048 [Tanacetum coccineum]|uniref:Uncharacterized protein n=1 Tax=Tanacetum coccineum TaxID=301880 RepID=A0ABQ5E648_9ASTR
MAGSDDEIPPPPPPQTQTPTQQVPHTVSTIKLPILKKGEYDIWAMKIFSTDTNGVIKVLPPKIAKEILARERERKARTTLLMALPEDHLAKFYKIRSKRDWELSQIRFGLLSQLEIHGAGVSTEDANQKFLSTQNVAFVSENTSSTNKVNTAYGASSSSGHGPQREGSSSYTDKLISKRNQDSRRRDVGYTRYKAKDSERKPGKQEE